jgi:protein gp37
MSAKTGIQWTDATWNPVVGCTQVSPGCAHCYAKQLHDQRHKASLEGKMAAPQYREPFETVQLKPDRLTVPLSWREPRRIFVNSVSDLFHDDVPDEYIAAVFGIMAAAEHHTFQVLTKRPARMLAFLRGESRPNGASLREWCYYAARDRIGKERLRGRNPWQHEWPLSNVWLGVSVENQRFADERIPLLLQTPAAVRFLSCEPLLARVDLTNLPGPFGTRFNSLDDSTLRAAIDWVIVGGESGTGAREFDMRWLFHIVTDCRDFGVPLFVKQLGRAPVVPNDTVSDTWPGGIVPLAEAYQPHHQGEVAPLDLHDAHGANMAEWPEWLRIREFPATEGLVP